MRMRIPSKPTSNVICNFAKTANLKLNASKLEVVRIGQQYKDQKKLNIAGVETSTTPAVKLFGSLVAV